MGDDLGRKLGDFKRSQAQRCLEARDFAGALERLAQPRSKEERDLASTCHYELTKAAVTQGHIGAARAHAAAVLTLNVAPKGIRYLVGKRLDLLNQAGPPTPALTADLRLGTAAVPGLGNVVVLGEHGTWGRPQGLAPVIELLKKAPQELDDSELEARERIIDRIGAALALGLHQAGIAERIDLIAPIPTDPSRFAVRRYSQQERVADALARHALAPCVADLLEKTRETKTLRGLSREEREAELKGSMAVSQRWRHLAERTTVLLVDDVVTYGTHFREARRVLTQAGAAEVLGCAVATGRDNFRPLPHTRQP